MISALYVFLGGGLGSICRYGIGQIVDSTNMPIGTLTANIISSLILGYLLGSNTSSLLKSESRLFLMFSTFSTFSGEIFTQLQGHQSIQAVLYLTISIVAGVLSIAIGWYAARYIHI